MQKRTKYFLTYNYDIILFQLILLKYAPTRKIGVLRIKVFYYVFLFKKYYYDILEI